MSQKKNIFGKAAALTAIISAATALFWAAIAYFNKKADSQKHEITSDPSEDTINENAD